MIHGNLKWLVWKEYRQHRLIVLGMLFLLVLPYLVFPIVAYVAWLVAWLRDRPTYQGASDWLLVFLRRQPTQLLRLPDCPAPDRRQRDRQRAYRPVGGVPVQPADFTAEEPGRQSPTGAADVRRDLAAECRCVLGHGVRIFAL